MKKIFLFFAALLFMGSLSVALSGCADRGEKPKATAGNLEKATFAGGCFWCMQPPYDKLKGVISTQVGYTGGHTKNPTYEDVSTGETGHAEAVEVLYDPARTRYEELLDIFWRSIDPTARNSQFSDRGSQYRTVIFYHNAEQKRLALTSKEVLEKSGRFSKPIVTEILPAQEFYPAEEKHQGYYKKNPLRYKLYKSGSGRETFLKESWGERKAGAEDNNKIGKTDGRMSMKPSAEELRKQLTPLQFRVTQEEGTERPFDNKYWNNHRPGIYVDIVSGEPLFSSTDKFESGTGWPSFMKPLEPGNIQEQADKKLFMKRTEVRSRQGGSHLGHVFPDGPNPTGLRYCINSAALRFIPAEDLEKEGYGEYRRLFERKQD